MKSIIHIDQHALKRNRKAGTREPVITVKTYKTNLRGHAVQIDGPAKIVYSPDNPLSCGATVWIETQAPVKLV